MTNPSITNVDVSVLATGDNVYIDATIADGNEVVAGQVLGVITASGKYAPLDSTAEDGSQLAVAIAVVDVDASEGDVRTQVMIAGKVDGSKLVFEGSDTINTVPDGSADSYLLQLRQYDIYVENYGQMFEEDNQ